jgi:hypothetical protein
MLFASLVLVVEVRVELGGQLTRLILPLGLAAQAADLRQLGGDRLELVA